MDVGTAEMALAISGVMCLVSVLNHRATSKARDLARIEAEHQRELETREYRTETRGLMERQGEDITTIKMEQRELRSEVRCNSEHINELSARHEADVARLSGRIDRVDGQVGDLMGVMRGEAELEMEDEKEDR